MKILNRFTGKVLFEADADSIRLCVELAIQQGANLSGANLSGADLWGANLSGADLWGADLSGAILWGARLSGANLSGADLSGASLWGARLSGANLSGARLSGADLWDANLSGANLWDNKYAKHIATDNYPVIYTSEFMQIGCERHSLSDWWSFGDERIIQMDGKHALRLWRKWKPILQTMIDAAPCEPTRYNASDDAGEL